MKDKSYKTSIKYYCFVLAFLFPLIALSQEKPYFTPISKNQYPALVFTEEDNNCDPSERMRLMIATFDSDKPIAQKVITSQYIETIHLADAVFLIKTNQRPKDQSLWKQEEFLVDFQTGNCALLSQSQSRDKLVHIVCIYSSPDKNEAIILRYGQGVDSNALLHIDLKTLAATPLYTLPKTGETRWFDSIDMRISPDFKMIATMVSHGFPTTSAQPFIFSLRLLDLETMETTDLDNKIEMEISGFCSSLGGRPPFDWLGPQDIIYQHMIPNDKEKFHTTAQYVLKCVNVRTKKIDECIMRAMQLRCGNKIHFNRFTGKLMYDNFFVDIGKRVLTPYTPCYSVDTSKYTEIRFRDKIIYHNDNKMSVWPCISHSQKHFAYFVRRDDGPATPTVYAQTESMKQPVMVAEVPFYTTLITWIEDTSNLREKQ